MITLLVSRSGADTVCQHYDATHRSIECSECDREFETQKAMDQVFVQHSTANRHLRLTTAQHYNAKHCFRCGGCDRKFKTEESMNQVPYLVPWSAPDCYPLTATPAPRYETHFWLMTDLRRKESEGSGSFSSVSVKH